MPPKIICKEDAPLKLQSAVELANKVMTQSDFYEGIRKHKEFKSTPVKPFTIAQLIESCELNFYIDTFEPNEH